MIFVFVWILSTTLSLVYVVLLLTKGLDSHYAYTWSSGVKFWQDFPFGMGYSSAIFIAGFSVFPVINTAIVVAITCWAVYRMKKDNLTLSDLFSKEESK